MSTLLQSLNNEMSAVVEKARSSLVQIHHDRRGNGAGTILHPDGLVVTNAHVVGRGPMGRNAIQVTLWNDQTLPGRLIAYDENIDLAAITIEARDLPAMDLGNGRQIRPGQWVFAMGHPWGVTGATTAGMVIAVGQPMEGIRYQGDLIQVGLHLRPGHSGGPMLDGDGRLVGINTMIAGPDVGLAIPIQTVKRFLKQALGTAEGEVV